MFFTSKISLKNTDINVIITKSSVDGFDALSPVFHFHTNYEIHYIIRGTYFFEIEGRKIPAKENTLIIINPKIYHYVYTDFSQQNEKISFQLSLCCKETSENNYNMIYQKIQDYIVLKENIVEFKLLKDIFINSAKNEIEEKASAIFTLLFFRIRDILLKKFDYSVCSEIEYVNSDDDKSRIQSILSYIFENSQSETNLSKIAEHINLSKKQTERIILKELGCSFKCILNSFKIQKALFILNSEKDSASNISLCRTAEKAGYNNYNNFYMEFKKQLGITPTEYIKSFINKKTGLTS